MGGFSPLVPRSTFKKTGSGWLYAAAPYIDDDTRAKVEQIGAVCISTEFERTD